MNKWYCWQLLFTSACFIWGNLQHFQRLGCEGWIAEWQTAEGRVVDRQIPDQSYFFLCSGGNPISEGRATRDGDLMTISTRGKILLMVLCVGDISMLFLCEHVLTDGSPISYLEEQKS